MVCAGCQSLFPLPRSVDYFELLGVDRRFSLDEGSLTSAFRAVARHVHPDRFSGQPEEVRALATRLSADLNNAITVLTDPLSRAAYMLELAGGPPAAEERGVPGHLLAEVMELREKIEEAQDSDDREALEEMRSPIATRRGEMLERIGKAADMLDSSSDGEKRELRLEINAVKYLDTLLEELAADPFAQSTGRGDG